MGADNKRSNRGYAADLRGKAEKMLYAKPEDFQYASGDVKRLIEELLAYQDQLERKNEDLRSVQSEFEEARNGYFNLFDLAPVGYFTIDRSGKILDVNAAGADLLGADKDSLITAHFSRFVAADFQDSFFSHWQNVLESGDKHTCCLKLGNGNRDQTYVQLESLPIYDEAGSFQHLRTAIMDITQRKRAEDELEKRTNDFIDSVKELNCIFAISRLVEDHNASLGTILQNAVEIVPFAFRKPESVCARISVDSQTYATENYRETVFKQNSDIEAYGKKAGLIEVCRLGEETSHQRQILFNEKQRMITAIAERLGTVIERKRGEDALRKRDAIIDAVSFAAARALGDKFREGRLTELLKKFGQAMGVSRVYIFENREAENGAFLTTQRYEWVAPGIGSQMSNPDVHNFNWYEDGMGRWADLMIQGQVIYGRVVDLPQSEQEILLPQGIQSILAVPIFVGDRWHGFIGFDECLKERTWSSAEVDSLKVAADLLGAAIHHGRADRALRESEERYRQLVEKANDIVYRTDPQGCFTFVNPIALRIFGYSEAEIIGKHYISLLPKDYQKKAERFYRAQFIKRIANTYYELPVMTKDGKAIWLGQNVQFINSEDRFSGFQAVARDITDRRLAEEALRLERDFAESLIETAQVMILVLDANGCIVRFNSYMEEVAGYQLEEVKGKDWFNTFLPQQIRTKTRKIYCQSMLGDRTRGNKIPIVTKEGTERLIEWSDKPLRDSEGAIVGMLCIGQDVTERDQSEAALKASEEKYRTLVESSPDAILTLDKERKIISCNRACFELFGYEKSELQGREIEIIRHFSSRNRASEEAASPAIDQSLRTEGLFQHKNGSVFPAETVTSALVGLDGAVMGYIAIIRDITERKRTEKALRESERKYRTLVETMSDGMDVFDENGYITYVNKRFCEIMGYSSEELEGRHFSKFLDEKNQTIMTEQLERRRKGFEGSYEIEWTKKDGSRVLASMSPKAIFDDYGTFRGSFAVVSNISEIKRTEAHIRFLTQQLLRAQETERQRISHELHDSMAQKLFAVKTGLDTLFDSWPEAPLQQKRRVSELSGILQESLRSVRELAYDLRPASLDDLGLAKAIYQYCQDFFARTGIIVDFMTAGIGDRKFDFDTEISLFRLIQEVLNNVAKHAQAKNVNVKLVGTSQNIILRIADDGKGFDVENRLASAISEKHMGLQSMEERVGLLQGTMRIESGSKMGTTVFIEVPCGEQR